jgi:hypothetical protein
VARVADEGLGELFRDLERDAIGRMPAYQKLVDKQKDVLHGLDEPFESRADLYDWLLDVEAVAFGRLARRAKVVLSSEIVLPFLVLGEGGDSKAGRVTRALLQRYLIFRVFGHAQDRFAAKAREEARVREVYLEKPTVDAPWEAFLHDGPEED